MKKLAIIFYSVCILTALQCKKGDEKKDPQEAPTSTTDSTSVKREEFFTKSNASCLLIADLMTLSERSSSEQLTVFVASSKPEQNKIFNALLELAQTKNIVLPDTLDARRSRMITSISEKNGVALDQALARTLSSEMRRLTNQFRKTEDINDPELKAMAALALPMLKKQTEELRKVRKSITPDKESKKRKEVPA
jgi:predicted outer membrane protein